MRLFFSSSPNSKFRIKYCELGIGDLILLSDFFLAKHRKESKMLILVIISALVVFVFGLFARFRIRPWWLWLVWLGSAIAAFITLAALEPTWQQALAVVAGSSVLGLLGPEVWRMARSILWGLWRRLRRWIRQRPIRILYLIGGLALLISPINPQLGGSALALVLVIIGLRVMFLGFRPTRGRRRR